MSDDAKVESAADGEGSDDEVDEPLPLMRINSFTVKGLGLVHNYVPVIEDDSGKRCVVDGFPENSTMRFMGMHSGSDKKLQSDGQKNDGRRCVVQVENPDGEDNVLTEKGLLVRLVKVKLAHDETIVSGSVLKRGGNIKSWKKRFACLDGDGCLRYYTDATKKKLKGVIDVRRDCHEITDDAADAGWLPTSKPAVQLCLVTAQRVYYFITENDEDSVMWRNAFSRVARHITHRTSRATLEKLVEPESPRKEHSGGSGGGGGDDGDIVPEAEPEDTGPVECKRVRKHMFRSAVTNNKQPCKTCKKAIGYRVKHRICTQCRKRYHLGCLPLANADCRPPPFGTPQAVKRIRPPGGTNLAAAVDFTSTSGCVPGLVEDLIAILDSRGMVEGIYRVPGNKTGMHDLVTRYFDNPARKRVGIYQIENVHTCSSALKLFLRNLDEPLTTFEFYHDFIVAVSLKDPEHREAQMGHVLGHLPLYNFHTLKVLIQHLHRISDSVAETKMKKSNLAAVFAPTLMQCPSGDDEGIQHVMAQMKCIDVLLKLKPETWESAEGMVITAQRIQSSSPTPKEMGATADSPSTTNRFSHLSNVSNPDYSALTSTPSTVRDSTMSITSDDAESETKPKIGSRSSSVTRANPLFGCEVTLGENQDEIEELLEESGINEDFHIDDAADVVEGEAEGAMMPGFEEFSLDSFGDGAVTLDLKQGRRKKAVDRLSGNRLSEHMVCVEEGEDPG